MVITERLASPRTAFWGPTLLLLAAAWGVQTAAGPPDAVSLLVNGTAVLAGCAALGWLRPALVGITAPQAMMLLSTLGMVAGLSWDARNAGVATLASLCFSGPAPDLATLMELHWQWLPAMHIGMVGGGLAAVPLLRMSRRNCRRQLCARLTQNLACSAWMIVGMSAGSLLAHKLAGDGSVLGASAMMGTMFAGMVWGMVVSVALYRLYFRWRGPAAAGA